MLMTTLFMWPLKQPVADLTAQFRGEDITSMFSQLAAEYNRI